MGLVDAEESDSDDEFACNSSPLNADRKMSTGLPKTIEAMKLSKL